MNRRHFVIATGVVSLVGGTASVGGATDSTEINETRTVARRSASEHEKSEHAYYENVTRW